MTVAGGGIESGAATAAEHESRVGEGHDAKIGGDQEGEEEDEGGEEEGEEEEAGDEDEDGEDGEGGDKEGEGEGGGEEDRDEDEDEDGEDDDDDDERVSLSEQDEDAWEDVAYESLARNLGRRRRRYLISRSSQVLRGNLQKLSGLI